MGRCGIVDEFAPPIRCPRVDGDAEVQCAYHVEAPSDGPFDEEKSYCALACEDDSQCPGESFCALVQYPMGMCIFRSASTRLSLFFPGVATLVWLSSILL